MFQFAQELLFSSMQAPGIFFLFSSLLACIAPELGGDDPWILTTFPGFLFPPGLYPVIVYHTDPCMKLRVASLLCPLLINLFQTLSLWPVKLMKKTPCVLEILTACPRILSNPSWSSSGCSCLSLMLTWSNSSREEWTAQGLVFLSDIPDMSPQQAVHLSREWKALRPLRRELSTANTHHLLCELPAPGRFLHSPGLPNFRSHSGMLRSPTSL